jgi:hypothetical protein
MLRASRGKFNIFYQSDIRLKNTPIILENVGKMACS